MMDLASILRQGMPPARTGAVIPDGSLPQAPPPMPPMPSQPVPLPPQAPQPVPVPQPVAATPAQPTEAGGGSRMASILQQLAPIVASLVVAKRAGAPAAGAFLGGFLQHQKEQEQELKRQALVDETKRAEYQQHLEKKQMELENLVLDLPAQAGRIASPDAFPQWADTLDMVAVSRYGLPKGQMKALAMRYAPSVDRSAVTEANNAIKNIGTDADLRAAIESGAVVSQFRGRQNVPVSELWSLANMPVDAKGKPVLAQTPAKVDSNGISEGDFIATEVAAAKEAAKQAGKTLTPAEVRKATLDARFAWSNATPRPASSLAGSTTADDSDVSELSAMLFDGAVVPNQLGKRSNYNEIIAGASRLSRKLTGKPYNAVKADVDLKSAMAWASSANSTARQRLLGLANSVVPLMDDVIKAAEPIANGNWQFANRKEMEAYLAFGANTPRGQAYVMYNSAIKALEAEFAQLEAGGYSPTEPAYDLARKQINGNFGFQAINSALVELKRIIGYRVKGMTEIQPQYIGGGSDINLPGAGESSPVRVRLADGRTGTIPAGTPIPAGATVIK